MRTTNKVQTLLGFRSMPNIIAILFTLKNTFNRESSLEPCDSWTQWSGHNVVLISPSYMTSSRIAMSSPDTYGIRRCLINTYMHLYYITTYCICMFLNIYTYISIFSNEYIHIFILKGISSWWRKIRSQKRWNWRTSFQKYLQVVTSTVMTMFGGCNNYFQYRLFSVYLLDIYNHLLNKINCNCLPNCRRIIS